ncbi:MAG: LemA family protein [Erysipelotrichaceae bacterium]|nr:LemA family protein [Erysipelotrichaceae bacterium]
MKYFFLALIVLLVVAIVYIISTHNSFVALENKIEEAISTMDVFLVKRAELIPNLVATVKGYAKHEAETLEKVIEARQKAITGGDSNARVNAENAITDAVRSLFAVAESYPQLKADSSFTTLQKQLESIEDDVAASRRYYNGIVRQYNTKLQTFPSSLVANFNNLQKHEMFEAADDAQRANVKVEF